MSVRVSIIGGSGYVGGELLRLLLCALHLRVARLAPLARQPAALRAAATPILQLLPSVSHGGAGNAPRRREICLLI